MRVFISYSSKDKEFAAAVKQAIEKQHGFECFLARANLMAAEEWKKRIEQELCRAHIFVALLSANFKASDWCGQEIGFVASRLIDGEGEKQKPAIVPLSIDGTEPYGFISHVHAADVPNESVIPEAVADLLFSARPREIIANQIERIRSVSAFKDAPTALNPLVKHFWRFTDSEISEFVDAVNLNPEVWGCWDCKETLRRFLEVNGDRIPEEKKRELAEHLANQMSALPPFL